MIEDEKRMFAGMRLTRKEEDDRCAHPMAQHIGHV